MGRGGTPNHEVHHCNREWHQRNIIHVYPTPQSTSATKQQRQKESDIRTENYTPYEANTKTPTRMTAVEDANSTRVIQPSISW